MRKTIVLHCILAVSMLIITRDFTYTWLTMTLFCIATTLMSKEKENE